MEFFPAVRSLALGTADVTLLEMTRAFAAVAAGVHPWSPTPTDDGAGGALLDQGRREGLDAIGSSP